MHELLQEFRRVLINAFEELKGISDDAASAPRAPGKWSCKEIIGHLIDSAANNHQRFVRAQLEEDLSLPGYEQDRWVEVQRYAKAEWKELLVMWRSYNTHLLHVIAGVPEEKLENRLRIGDGEFVTLRFLITDYVRHLKHHLAQIDGALNR